MLYSSQVQRCFQAWSSGAPPDGYPPFSDSNASSLILEYATGPSIRALVNKPHRFNDLIKAAYAKLNTPEPSSKSVPARSKASTHKAAVVIEPSSEPEHDEEDIEEVEEGSVNEGEVEDDDSDVVMDVSEDVAEERENAAGGEITVKAEELDEVYVLGGGFRDDGENSGGPVSAGISTPRSTLTLEVDGLEIISLPATRRGSLEPQHSRGPPSPSLSLLSID